MTVLIDSWTWIEYWKGGPRSRQAADYIDGSETAIVSTVNLAETLYWVMRHYDEPTVEEKRLTIAKRCFLIPLDMKIAVDAAKTKKKTKLGLADSIVLATARNENATIVTGDPDFRGMNNVFYIGPLTGHQLPVRPLKEMRGFVKGVSSKGIRDE